MRIIRLVALVTAATGCVRADDAAWDALVKEYVTKNSRVDYARWKRNTAALDAWLDEVARPWPASLTAAERKARSIDVYNALTVRWVLRNYPVASVWRTSHPFNAARHTIDGQKVSLDDIETRLRKLGDPRIHGALVCAALSCPPLRREAYAAERSDAQLDDNVRAWLANDRLNQFDPVRRVASVSMIFKWYARDFDGVPRFLSRYAPQAAFLLESGAKIKYNEYRWGLNDTSDLGRNYTNANFLLDKLRSAL